jgi:proton-coupled amino acid transporter
MVCWTAFGDDVNTVLTTSLPDGVLATMIQLAYSVAVIFTFPLQIFPALEIIVHAVERRILIHGEGEGGGESSSASSSSSPPLELSPRQRMLVVSIVISLLSIIAFVEMDNLGRVVSLMGSLFGVPLAFIFPPLIHSKIVPGAPKRINMAVALAGFLAMIGATFTTLATWSEGGGEGRRLVG